MENENKPILDFIDFYDIGINWWKDLVETWCLKNDPNIHIVTYNSLLSDTSNVLRKIIPLFHVKPDENIIQKVIEKHPPLFDLHLIPKNFDLTTRKRLHEKSHNELSELINKLELKQMELPGLTLSRLWIEQDLAKERYGITDDELRVMIKYNLPFPLNHYYMPIPSIKNIIAKNMDRIPLSLVSIFNVNTIKTFFDKFKVEIKNAPDYDSVAKLGLGLGYGSSEAKIYYSIVKSFDIKNIIEIGGGISTYFARISNHNTKITVIEPYPNETFKIWCINNDIDLQEIFLDTNKIQLFLSKLTNESILFIDSTHNLRNDGELLHIFLDMLPNVPVGCLIHFHDIFLPYAVIAREHDMFPINYMWNESAILAIFLKMNPCFEIIFPQYWLATHHELNDFFDNGSSFWMRRVK